MMLKNTEESSVPVVESTITIRWVFVLLLFIGIFGFFFTSVLSQEKRIIRVETQFESVGRDISEIKTGIRELRTLYIDKFLGSK